MEKSLMDLMYRTPSDNTICKCIITKDAVDGTGEPEVFMVNSLLYSRIPQEEIPVPERQESRRRLKEGIEDT